MLNSYKSMGLKIHFSQAFCKTVSIILLLISGNTFATNKYGVELSGVRYKSDFFETLKSQRDFLYRIGFPSVETDIEQNIDKANDSYQISFLYRKNRFLFYRASYLGKSDFLIESQLTHLAYDDRGELIRRINTSEKIKLRMSGIASNIHVELPIRKAISIGGNVGLVIARSKVEYSMTGFVGPSLSEPDGESPIGISKSNVEIEMSPVVGMHMKLHRSEKWSVNFYWHRYFNMTNAGDLPAVIDSSGEVVDMTVSNDSHVDSYGVGLEYKY